MKQIFILFFCYSFLSCRSQVKVTLHVFNRSSLPIDSFLVRYGKDEMFAEIDQNKEKTITVHINKEEIGHEGNMEIYTYQKDRTFRGGWGYYFFGVIKKEDSLYIFDHGINNIDAPLEQPKTFRFFIENKSSESLDSIRAKPESQIKNKPWSSGVDLTVDFRKFSEDPVLLLFRNGTSKEVAVHLDWDNWNINQQYLTISDGGIVSITYKNKFIK